MYTGAGPALEYIGAGPAPGKRICSRLAVDRAPTVNRTDFRSTHDDHCEVTTRARSQSSEITV